MANFYILKQRAYKIIKGHIKINSELKRQDIYSNIFMQFGFGKKLCDDLIDLLMDQKIIKEENGKLYYIAIDTEDKIKIDKED